jgi:hypothetical protein
MRAGFGLVLLLLAQGCGERRAAEVNSEMLNRIAIQHNQTEDVGATVRLQPIEGIVAPPGYGGPECRFTRGADELVHGFSASAAARVGNALRVFRAEGPVGPTGGFFRDRELALSIGAEHGAPARARVTNRATEVREDVEGQWQCTRASR